MGFPGVYLTALLGETPELMPTGLACPNAGLGQDLSAFPSHHEMCDSLHPWPFPGGLGLFLDAPNPEELRLPEG